MPEEEKKDAKVKATRGVKKEEFEQFKGEVTTLLGEISKKLENTQAVTLKVAESANVSTTIPKPEGGPETPSLVSPAWRALTDEILGTDFEIGLELPETGGQRFSIYVPKEKSNAGKDHWERNKFDKRTRELGNTGVKGVKDWLLKIRRNLVTSGIKLPYYEDNTPVGLSMR
jgi:hypothetical protein